MTKDIVVHLTGSAEDAARLDFADAIAQRFDAHLAGLQVHVLPEVISYTDPSGSAFLRELMADSDREAEKVGARLTEALAKLGPHAELRRLDLYTREIGDALAAEVRVADLFIGTRPSGDPGRQARVDETVLFRCGRACFLLPPQFDRPVQLKTVYVAWKSTPEAARAIAAAIPLLQQAEDVVVGMVEERGSDFGSEPGADIGRYLSRHGIKAEIRMVRGNGDTGPVILKEARAIGANLIVMGGYGHSRLRELVLGGATRDVLGNSQIPVLMAH
jgi:nucleotide-binding universal stress UspA family protein